MIKKLKLRLYRGVYNLNKIVLYSLLIVFSLFSFSVVNTISAETQPLEESVRVKEKDGGEIVFRFKTDFLSLSNFLKLTEKDFFQLREDKSLVEIAKMQGINEGDLFNYLVDKRYKALESGYNKGQVDLYFVMNYVLHLKEDVEWEMKVKKLWENEH